MASGSFRFDRFVLDPDDRQLRRDDAPVELNARYLDALILLVQERGRLFSKERFLDEVWRGVPVTDEALTQCIKTLRRQLGDDLGVGVGHVLRLAQIGVETVEFALRAARAPWSQ